MEGGGEEGCVEGSGRGRGVCGGEGDATRNAQGVVRKSTNGPATGHCGILYDSQILKRFTDAPVQFEQLAQ